MVGPLLAAGTIVGVLVPRATDRAADADLRQAVSAATTVLGERCLGLSDLATSAAIRLDAAGPAARADVPGVSATLAPLVATRSVATLPAVTLLLVTGDQVVAGAGPLAPAAPAGGAPAGASGGTAAGPSGATGTGTWNPATALGASCTRRAAGTSGTPQLVEWADLAVAPGVPPSRVAAVQPLDAAALDTLREGLGLPDLELALLSDGGGEGSAGPAPLISTANGAGSTGEGAGSTENGSGATPADLVPVLARAASGGVSGEESGWTFRQRQAAPGVPYTVVVLTPAQGGALQVTLLVVVLLATAALVGTVTVITDRLTGPLGQLTTVARRLGGGDLAARTGIRGTDEVGTLAAAFDSMADDLESTVGELRASQDALSQTFAHFGAALGATHDLDSLLRTVVAAVMRGSESSLGTASLGDAKHLELRVVEPADAPPGHLAHSAEAMAGLADLAGDAARRGELVVTDLVDAAGPALAVPLRRDARVMGVLAVVRDIGAAPFDDLALDAVRALAAHAGTAVANVRTHEETSRQSITDPLTGAGNYRHLKSTLAREVERATRFNRPLSLLMLDLDHFKQVNDTAGHAFGDAVLREFARRLGGCLREVDVVTRYGGEEFVVVLPETAAEGACSVAARIVEAVRRDPFRAGSKSRPVTVSVGVSAFPDHGRNSSEIMRAADAALYSAKHEGRDRWVLAGGTGGKGVAVAQTG